MQEILNKKSAKYDKYHFFSHHTTLDLLNIK